jgi:hypothetical protein
MSCVLALSAFLGDIFFSGVGITLFKTLVLTNLVFALVLVHGPAVFKSEVDWRTGGPECLHLSKGIVSVPADK